MKLVCRVKGARSNLFVTVYKYKKNFIKIKKQGKLYKKKAFKKYIVAKGSLGNIWKKNQKKRTQYACRNLGYFIGKVLRWKKYKFVIVRQSLVWKWGEFDFIKGFVRAGMRVGKIYLDE